jgi:hypothetical protein
MTGHYDPRLATARPFLLASCAAALLLAGCGGGGAGGSSVLPLTEQSHRGWQNGNGNGNSSPSPSPSPSASPSASASPVPGAVGQASPAASASPSPTPAPIATPTPKPSVSPTNTPTPSPTAAPSGTVVWQAGSAALGNWVVADTYQCGSAAQNGAQLAFNLTLNGTNCGRNQVMPESSPGVGDFVLTSGATYTWTFTYVDGTPTGAGPGMGSDSEAQSLIWQLHANGGSGVTPSLGFGNAANGAQEWVLEADTLWGSSTNPDYVWTGTYTPGETDTWKITATISNTGNGAMALWRNGVEVYSVSGVNTYDPTTTTGVWWNFGPYKWRWELANAGGSDMTSVNCTIDNMTLTQQ